MKLKTSELKQFKSKASAIPTNTILPICSYLHFKPGQVTKNAMQSFVSMKIDCDEEMLVDEKILMSYVSVTKDETIEIKKDGTQVVIGTGKFKDYSPTDDPSLFPVSELPENDEWINISALIPDILICSALIMDEPLMPVQSNVFIGNGMVAVTDNIVAYIKKTELEKEIIISKFAAGVVGRLGDTLFNENESYQFFSNDGCFYGFIKPAVKLADFSPFISDLTQEANLIVDKDDVTKFNEHVISTSNMPNPVGMMTMTLNNIKIEVLNAAYERSIQRDIECVGAVNDKFVYNTTEMNKLLKTIPGDKITLTRFKNFLYITGDNNFISLIMQTSI